ncbi:MAG: hypothetical protein AAGC70_12450 [Pseudomonadota bacterium]
MAELTIRDETLGGNISHTQCISFSALKVTVRDIITERVRAEVDAYNNKAGEYFTGLVKPTDAEQVLNGYKMQKRRFVDPDKQVAVALDAFSRNRFFILVDDQQAEDLDQIVELDKAIKVSFVKLTPLVGG